MKMLPPFVLSLVDSIQSLFTDRSAFWGVCFDYSTTNVYINGLAPYFKAEELSRLASEFGKVLSFRVFHRFNQTKPNGGGQQQGS